MNYNDQIKSGKWQKKRLEIMQRDDFQCLCCQSENQLTVHHLYYLPGLKVWEYDNDSLVTVCEKCHNILTFDYVKISGLIAFKALQNKVDFVRLNEFMEALINDEIPF